MNQTAINIPRITFLKYSIGISNRLNGTSADTRFINNVKYTSALTESFNFELESINDSDWEKDYGPLMKRSAVLEELQREHI